MYDFLHQHVPMVVCPFLNITDINALIRKYFASTLSYTGILNAFLQTVLKL